VDECPYRLPDQNGQGASAKSEQSVIKSSKTAEKRDALTPSDQRFRDEKSYEVRFDNKRFGAFKLGDYWGEREGPEGA
jgi:hypothetical protein